MRLASPSSVVRACLACFRSCLVQNRLPDLEARLGHQTRRAQNNGLDWKAAEHLAGEIPPPLAEGDIAVLPTNAKVARPKIKSAVRAILFHPDIASEQFAALRFDQHWFTMGGMATLPSQGDYRLLAQYFLALARSCPEPSEADRYRAIAADYLLPTVTPL